VTHYELDFFFSAQKKYLNDDNISKETKEIWVKLMTFLP
jgi:hypothetical protein